MPIYIYRNGASPEGPKNPLARLLSSIGALVMLALLAVVLLPVFGVVILFLIGEAAVFFIVFAVKNWH